MSIESGFLLIIFIISGITLKLADIYGEKGNNVFQYVFAVASAVSFSLLIAHSSTSSSIILGIIIGVSASRKVNRKNLILGLILTLSASSVLGLIFNGYSWLPIPWLLIIVSLVTLLDEICHDKFTEKKSVYTELFRFRPLLKLTIVSLALTSFVDATNALGFLSFDLAYDATGWLINRYSP